MVFIWSMVRYCIPDLESCETWFTVGPVFKNIASFFSAETFLISCESLSIGRIFYLVPNVVFLSGT